MEHIGHTKYKFLKQFSHNALTPEEVKQIEAHEKQEAKKYNGEYFEQYAKDTIALRELELKGEKPVISEKEALQRFYAYYQADNKHPFGFDLSGKPVANKQEAKHFLYTMLYYFMANPRFFKSPLLTMKNSSIPSLEKGNCIVGDYGCGKTSTLKALHKAFSSTKFAFTYRYAKDVMLEYKHCEKAHEEADFYNRQKKNNTLYDDILSERKVKKFGDNFEVVGEVLVHRYSENAKTHVVLNFHKEHPFDTGKALLHAAERYGNVFYDRIFKMFNIIELAGASNRR